MNKLLSLIFIGSLSGFIGGLLGGGSDVLIVPLLLILGVYSNIKTAIGTSLASLIPPIGIFAVYQYWKKGNVGIKDSLIIALSFTLVSTLSANLGLRQNENILKKIYSIFLIISGTILFYKF